MKYIEENIETQTINKKSEVLHAFTGAPTEYYYNKNSLMSEIEIWQLVNLLIKYKMIIS